MWSRVKEEWIAMGTPVEDDADVRRALAWLLDSTDDRNELLRRVGAARRQYLDNASFENPNFHDIDFLLPPRDPMAGYLAQGFSLLTDRTSYDLRLAPRVIPFLKVIGRGTHFLSAMSHARERAREMLTLGHPQHPDSGFFEFATAIFYARNCPDLEVDFILPHKEKSSPKRKPTPDIRIRLPDGEVEIECKRQRPSQWEKDESARARKIFEPFASLVAEKKLNVHVDVNFLQDLRCIPLDYLAKRVAEIVSSRSLSAYPWRDELCEGSVRPAETHAVHLDTRDSDLLVGPKMARLLTGSVVSEGSYFLAVGGKQSRHDPRYIHTLDYGSVLTWACSADESVGARARSVRKALAEVDIQLAEAEFGIAHIGMDTERDTKTADLRRTRNREVFTDFRRNSRLADIKLHYFLPRVSELHSWMVDETVETFAGPNGPVFEHARVLVGEADMPLANRQLPAWHQPPPATPG